MSAVILTDRPPVVKPPPTGPCVCGAEQFKPVLGGREVCMTCGHDREVQ